MININDSNYSIELGRAEKSINRFDCRVIVNDRIVDRVLVNATNFEQVKWCMIGYTGKNLNLATTSVRNVKKLIIPILPTAAGVCGEALSESWYSIIIVKL